MSSNLVKKHAMEALKMKMESMKPLYKRLDELTVLLRTLKAEDLAQFGLVCKDNFAKSNSGLN